MTALGARLAMRGPLVRVGIGAATLGTVVTVGAAFFLARRGGHDAATLPTWSSEAIAWSAGMTIAFGAAMRAFHGAEEPAALALVRARGSSVNEYVDGRVAGLAALLSIVVGGAAVVSALAATAAGGGWAAARNGATGFVYAMAFSSTMAAVTMATLGVRRRVSGYLAFVTVIALPELASPWTASLLPHGWHELTSIPAALDAIAAGVARPADFGARGLRAAALLLAVVTASVLAVRVRAANAEAEATR